MSSKPVASPAVDLGRYLILVRWISEPASAIPPRHGQTHFLYTGYFHPNGATEVEVQGMLRDFYHAVFTGIGRVLNVNFTIQQ